MSAAVTSTLTKPEIIIDLSQPLSTLLSSSKNNDDSPPILQEDAAQRIGKLLTHFHEQAKNHTKNQYDEFNPVRCNNTIFIDGERGAGKTTFLYSILQKYKNEKNEKKNNNLNICPLPLIDPTLVETHQHILIEIVTKFVRQLDKKLKCCQDESKYQKFREHLDTMAEGLQLLNKKDSSAKEPADSSWFLEKALNKATNGQDLERHFHQFLDIISDMHDIDLFLIAIDDVDTQTTKADEVLEVIRCYLTHPKLVILLSGDLKLYSHIVRNNKHTELNEQKNQKSDKAEALIGHLEQQYLAKILPVEQRIQLKRLDELSEKYEVKIKHSNLSKEKNDGLKNPIEIRELIKDIFSQALYFRKEHLKSHLDFLLSQPVRSVLQLLKTMLDAIDTSEANNFYQASTLKNAIYQSFIGDLVNENLKLENLIQAEPHINSIGHEVFKLLYKHGDLETGFYVRPDSNYDQSGYNAAKIYLSATMATLFSSNKNTNSTSLVIKMMLSCCATSNIYQTYVGNNLKEKFSFKDYIDYIGLSRNEDVTSLASHFSPIIFVKYNPSDNKAKNKGIVSGVFRTTRSMNGDAIKNFDLYLKDFNVNNKKRITTLSSLYKINNNFEDEKQKISSKSILFSSHSVKTQVEGRDYISAYCLLSAIAELIKDETPDLKKLNNINTYTYPTFLSGRDSGDEYFSDDDAYDQELSLEESNEFTILLSKWVSINKDGNYNFSSLLIGKIWTRINYTLSQIAESSNNLVNYEKLDDDTSKKYDIVTGVLFSRFVWGIINSFLIEEYRYSLKTMSQDPLNNVRNTNTSPKELIQNIILINKNINSNFKENLPLTYSLISCPILWPFLGKYKENGEIKDNLYNEVCLLLSEEEKKSFERIANYSEPSTLNISALAIMGCFNTKEDTNKGLSRKAVRATTDDNNI